MYDGHAAEIAVAQNSYSEHHSRELWLTSHARLLTELLVEGTTGIFRDTPNYSKSHEASPQKECGENLILAPQLSPTFGLRQHLGALKMVGDLDQRIGRNDLDILARPGRFCSTHRRTIRPSSRELAPITACNTPAAGAVDPSRPSSPSTVRPLNASGDIAPIAARSADRSGCPPSAGRRVRG
jgi:hypothetical protein